MKYRVALPFDTPAVWLHSRAAAQQVGAGRNHRNPVMSASSGPKDYTRANHVWAIFDRYPNA